MSRTRRFDAGGARLRDLGEAALLSRLVAGAGRVGAEVDPDGAATADESPPGDDDGSVIVGPGDDGAVWRPPAGRDLVVTQDALVEGEDFRRSWSTPHQIGARLLAVSLSDLAGMGARPSFCVAAFCAPEGTEVDDILAIQAGIVDSGTEHGCRLLGGDVSRIEGPLVLDLVAVGTVEPGRCLRRDSGRPGDMLVVTGVLGRAAAGLALLLAAEAGQGEALAGAAPGEAAGWIRAQLSPRPRVAEGAAMAGLGVRCGGDVSDGLIADLERTSHASRCGAELWADALPVDDALKEWFGPRWLEPAIGGGEDFELVSAVPRHRLDDVLAAWPAGLAPLSVVGRLTDGGGVHLLDRQNGTVMTLPAVQSRHFT